MQDASGLLSGAALFRTRSNEGQMQQKGIAFQRRFQVWAYTVSHKQLLLRSTKTEQSPTRIDVLFKDVVRMNLPTLIQDLEIEPLDSAHPESINISGRELADRTVYAVRGVGCEGYVVAGYFGSFEDEEEFYAPSALIQLPGELGKQA